MSEVAWSSQMMREVIAPPGIAPSVSGRIRAVARALKWKYSRVFSVWYADERVSLKPRELRQIEEITGVRYGQEEIREIDQLISRADAILAGSPPHIDGAVIVALRALVGALDRSRTSRD